MLHIKFRLNPWCNGIWQSWNLMNFIFNVHYANLYAFPASLLLLNNKKKLHTQRKHLEIYSGMKPIIILLHFQTWCLRLVFQKTLYCFRKKSWCCTWTHYWWHRHGAGEVSRLSTSGLSRAGIRAPLTAANHYDGSVWLSPSLPGVCSEASCQSHMGPDASVHLQGKSFRSIKLRSYTVMLKRMDSALLRF